MFKSNKRYFIAAITSLALLFYFSCVTHNRNSSLPIIAIANYGPHASLEGSIKGIKEVLAHHGFVENQSVRYEITDVSFQSSLIAQMIAKLTSLNPKAMVVMTTPVAQTAKNLVKDIPLIFSVITDPVEAGLLKTANEPGTNITGASDKQDLKLLLSFVRKLIPHVRTVGVLYATAEANDKAMIKMLESAAEQENMKVVAIPVDQARDVPLRVQDFKGKVDFIYVGSSGPIQPALPAIVASADKMKIPVFNSDSDAIKKHQAFGSFGVDYHQVGVNTGKILARLLKGETVSSLQPSYPNIKDHHGFISRRRADTLNISIPQTSADVTVVE